jgi:hypothetical protein
MLTREMNSLRLSFFCCLIGFGAILFSGCAGTPLNPPSGMIAGISASKSKVLLSREQEAKVASNIAFILPAGEYRPVYEDADGVYFEAPSKIIMKENFVGINLPGNPFDGGIYLHRNNPQVAKIYSVVSRNQGGEIQRMLKGGRPEKPMLPRQPVQFQLTHS